MAHSFTGCSPCRLAPLLLGLEIYSQGNSSLHGRNERERGRGRVLTSPQDLWWPNFLPASTSNTWTFGRHFISNSITVCTPGLLCLSSIYLYPILDHEPLEDQSLPYPLYICYYEEGASTQQVLSKSLVELNWDSQFPLWVQSIFLSKAFKKRLIQIWRVVDALCFLVQHLFQSPPSEPSYTVGT